MRNLVHFVRENAKTALSLVWGSLSVVLPFEFLYKLLAVNVLVPFASWGLSSVLKLQGFDYLAEENFREVLRSPLVLLTLFAILLLFTVYTIFEISFLTLSFHQSFQKKPLLFFRLVAISAQDALRAVKPRNYLLILLVILIIPVSNSVMVTSLMGGLEIPNYMVEIIKDTPLYQAAIAALLLLVLGLIMLLLFVFHYYSLEDMTARRAARRAMRLGKKRRIRMLWCFLLCQGAVWLLTTLVTTGIGYLITAVTSLFSYDESLYSWLLTGNMMVRSILSFVLPSLLVVVAYALITALFFYYKREDGEALPAVQIPIHRHNRRENLTLCLAVMLCGLVFGLGITYSAAHSADLGASQRMLVMAHRGYSEDAPENTLPAFQKAIDVGADYIELDVQETKDGEIVVTHDSNLYRCTGVKANVWELTLAEIKRLDASRGHRDYKGTQIPTLREVIELCKGKIRLNIELKSNGHETNLEKSVAAILSEYEFDDQVVITSLTKKCLIRFKNEKPDIPCGYIVSMAVGNYINVPWSDFFSVEQSAITESLVKNAHKHGKTISAWTVVSPKEAGRLIELGVDSLITNDPLMARETILAYADPLKRLHG